LDDGDRGDGGGGVVIPPGTPPPIVPGPDQDFEITCANGSPYWEYLNEPFVHCVDSSDCVGINIGNAATCCLRDLVRCCGDY
jgi:hypothetical protein